MSHENLPSLYFNHNEFYVNNIVKPNILKLIYYGKKLVFIIFWELNRNRDMIYYTFSDIALLEKMKRFSMSSLFPKMFALKAWQGVFWSLSSLDMLLVMLILKMVRTTSCGYSIIVFQGAWHSARTHKLSANVTSWAAHHSEKLDFS